MKKFQLTKKKSLIILFLVGLIALAVFFLYFRNKQHQESVSGSNVTTTSNTPTAQSNFTDGDDRQPGNTLQEGEGAAQIKDNSATEVTPTPSDQWTTSNTNEISVYSPATNATVKNNSTISGQSTLPVVSYRLIDAVSGVIGQGSLRVVNGKFSGTISFNTNASEGRIDIYATRDDGTEYSNIEIPVTFGD